MSTVTSTLHIGSFPAGSYAFFASGSKAAVEFEKIAGAVHTVTCRGRASNVDQEVPWAYSEFINTLRADNSLGWKFSLTQACIAENENIQAIHDRLLSNSLLEHLTPFTRRLLVRNVCAQTVRITFKAPGILLDNNNHPTVVQHMEGILMRAYNGWSNMGEFFAQPAHFRNLVDRVVQLNKHGIFHGDIRDSNIMVSNDDARLIDFGLAQVDGRHSRILLPKNSRDQHPLVRYFFTPKSHNSNSAKVMDSVKLVNLINACLQPGDRDFVNYMRDDPYFLRYMLHKKDLFDVANVWWKKRFYKAYLRGGGLLSCIGVASAKDSHPKNSSRMRSCVQNDAEVVRALEEHQIATSTLADLLSVDMQDFAAFRVAYFDQSLCE